MIYRRRFDADGSDSLAKLARWIAPGSRVLELGAAAGYFTEHLRAQRCTVDVIEIDAEAAREAARHATRTIVADLDGDAWMGELGEARYDAIVCADVLEHLRDGRRLLERLRRYVAEGGALLMSVPNVAHSAIIANLVDERFDYGGEGLLDPTHLRLYTWRSLSALLADTGYSIAAWDATQVELYDSEFRIRVEALAPALGEALVARPHANVYQWLVRAEPSVAPRQPPPPPALAGDAQHVPVRLLFGPSAAELSLDRAATARMLLGAGAQQLTWRLPAGSRALRLLLADRTGVVEVDELSLHAGNELVWTSRDMPDPFMLGPTTLAIDGRTLALVGDDAWIEPAVSDATAARADRVTATLSWPGDFSEAGGLRALLALANAVRMREAATIRAREEFVASIAAVERRQLDEASAHAQTQAALQETREALTRRNADFAKLEEAIEAYRAENARLDAALAAQERIIGYRQSLRWWLALPLMRVKWWWHRTVKRFR